MISKKGKTYALLVIVLGIWGTIGYQVYSKLNPKETSIIAASTDITFSPTQHIEKDTFQINSQHRDPFLEKPFQARNQNSVNKARSTKKDSIVFPALAYKGVISKKQSSQNIYIIEVSGIQQLFKVGKTIDKVRLISGNKKSVTITYQGKRKTISIAE